jgi:hypothetical protein
MGVNRHNLESQLYIGGLSAAGAENFGKYLNSFRSISTVVAFDTAILLFFMFVHISFCMHFFTQQCIA